MPLSDFSERIEDVELIFQHPNGDGSFRALWAEMITDPSLVIPELEKRMAGLDEQDKKELRMIAAGIEFLRDKPEE
ncbi:MAG: hypothetical protein AAB546_04495 [Patescibacteria group bacterium]